MSEAAAICADYGYLTPAETLIKSIAYHNHDLPIYLLNTNIPQEWFLNINRRLAPINVRVVDAKFSASVLKDEAVSRTEYMNTMIYGRLLIPQLVPADRVLYIDSDSVVDRSLQPLFATDLEGKVVGAVEDYSMPGTFNSGVLLLDNTKLKAIDNFTTDLLAKGQERTSNDDQTLLNQYFKDNWLQLDYGYNLQIGLDLTLFYNEHHSLPRFYQLLKKAQPGTIIHYSTSDKPWNFMSSGRLREKWWQYQSLEYSEIVRHAPLPTIRQHYRTRLFTFTQSEQLDNLETLLRVLPDCEFNVAAWTNIGDALLALTKYPNLHLFPAVVESNIDMLIDQADGYLDINEGGKELQFIERCVQRNKPLLSYNEYPDNPVLTAALQKFDREQPDQLIAAIKRL